MEAESTMEHPCPARAFPLKVASSARGAACPQCGLKFHLEGKDDARQLVPGAPLMDSPDHLPKRAEWLVADLEKDLESTRLKRQTVVGSFILGLMVFGFLFSTGMVWLGMSEIFPESFGPFPRFLAVLGVLGILVTVSNFIAIIIRARSLMREEQKQREFNQQRRAAAFEEATRRSDEA